MVEFDSDLNSTQFLKIPSKITRLEITKQNITNEFQNAFGLTRHYTGKRKKESL